MHAPSQADIRPWLRRGWVELDRKSPEGKLAVALLTADARRFVQRHARSFKRGRVPILFGTHDEGPAYLVPRGEQVTFVRKLDA